MPDLLGVLFDLLFTQIGTSLGDDVLHAVGQARDRLDRRVDVELKTKFIDKELLVMGEVYPRI